MFAFMESNSIGVAHALFWMVQPSPFLKRQTPFSSLIKRLNPVASTRIHP